MYFFILGSSPFWVFTFTETRNDALSLVQPGSFSATDAAIPDDPLPVPDVVLDPVDVAGSPGVHVWVKRRIARL